LEFNAFAVIKPVKGKNSGSRLEPPSLPSGGYESDAGLISKKEPFEESS
jgi:hypothetical protein